RQDLEHQEQQLREYKIRYIGELPEQEQSMLQMLAGAQSQLQANSAGLERTEQERVYLESMRTEYQTLQDSAAPVDGNAAASPLAVADATIRDLQKQLTDLQAKYTSRHPDVEKLRDEISDWELKRTQLEGKAGSTSSKDDEANALPTTQSIALAEVESRLKVNKVEIDDYQNTAKKLHAQIDDLEARLNKTPLREQQLAEVNRNYENSRQNYQSLLQKKMQSELATNLEERQQGEQFRIIDPPNLPLKPSEPNRLEIIAIGWALGLCVGLGLTSLKEMSDEAIRNERTLLECVPVSILVHVPILKSRRERIRIRLFHACEAMATIVLFVASVAIGIYAYIAG
ncbi:MAG: GNVR domain-containing protein, partial [Candidatus Acidiferrales bacterium]